MTFQRQLNLLMPPILMGLKVGLMRFHALVLNYIGMNDMKPLFKKRKIQVMTLNNKAQPTHHKIFERDFVQQEIQFTSKITSFLDT